jgi:hypothetical protein
MANNTKTNPDEAIIMAVQALRMEEARLNRMFDRLPVLSVDRRQRFREALGALDMRAAAVDALISRTA